MLSDAELKELSKDFFGYLAYGRAVESAVLEKLGAQEPVAWVLLRHDDDGLEPVMFYGGKDKPVGEFKDRFILRPVCFADSAPVQQEPVAWTPISQQYPQGSELDILMGDGSVLCAIHPQSDGDLWWEGAGAGEKFIDPKYATHWRLHSQAPVQQDDHIEENLEMVKAQNSKLVEALEGCVKVMEQYMERDGYVAIRVGLARAALAAVEGKV